jgi:hypothetical protein
MPLNSFEHKTATFSPTFFSSMYINFRLNQCWTSFSWYNVAKNRKEAGVLCRLVKQKETNHSRDKQVGTPQRPSIWAANPLRHSLLTPKPMTESKVTQSCSRLFDSRVFVTRLQQWYCHNTPGWSAWDISEFTWFPHFHFLSTRNGNYAYRNKFR